MPIPLYLWLKQQDDDLHSDQAQLQTAFFRAADVTAVLQGAHLHIAVQLL